MGKAFADTEAGPGPWCHPRAGALVPLVPRSYRRSVALPPGPSRYLVVNATARYDFSSSDDDVGLLTVLSEMTIRPSP